MASIEGDYSNAADEVFLSGGKLTFQMHIKWNS